ncbi:MAG: glycerol-3-phosphate 1-O-acyltransferase PlsY [Beijerinckiaceae bacterium]
MFDPTFWSSSASYYALAFLFGYFCGSIPFGLIVTRLAGTDDIRSIGSGSIGATNVLRTGRKSLAAATLLGDALKGTFAVWVASQWGLSLGIVAGLGAFLGHLFPVWLGFRGGKGIATYIGVLIALWLPGVLVFAAIWLSIAYLTRYSSLAGLSASAAMPVALYLAGKPTVALLFLVMAILVFNAHRANIERLRAGTEGKIGQKS